MSFCLRAMVHILWMRANVRQTPCLCRLEGTLCVLLLVPRGSLYVSDTQCTLIFKVLAIRDYLPCGVKYLQGSWSIMKVASVWHFVSGLNNTCSFVELTFSRWYPSEFGRTLLALHVTGDGQQKWIECDLISSLESILLINLSWNNLSGTYI